MYWFCDLLRTAITYEDHLNYYLEKLSTNDLVRWNILKDLDKRFHDVLEDTQGKKLIYKLDYISEGLNLIKADKNEI